MGSNTFSTNNDEIKRTLERVSYLASETRMLRRVIDYIPYDEKPPQQPSILEVLDQLRDVQRYYFKPFIQKLTEESSPIAYQDINDWYEQLKEKSGEPEDDVQKILQDITRFRKQLNEHLSDLDAEEWEVNIKQGDQEKQVVEVLDEVVEFERSLLSKISDRVRVFSQQLSTQRDIESRKQSQDQPD
jgi:hypothetical protein